MLQYIFKQQASGHVYYIVKMFLCNLVLSKGVNSSLVILVLRGVTMLMILAVSTLIM